VHGALLDAAILAAVVAKIHDAPDVDIRALTDLGEKRPAPQDSAPHSRHAAPTGSGPQSPNRFKNNALHEQARSLSNGVRTAYAAARDLPDFVGRLGDMGIRVRPNINGIGALHGFRFRTSGLYALGSDLGLGSAHFERGDMQYIPALHKTGMNELKDAYDAEFGPCDKECNDRYLSARFGPVDRVPFRGEEEPASETDDGETISAAVREGIDLVNDQEPRMDFRLYKDLKSGRDHWSTMDTAEVLDTILPSIIAAPAFRVISTLPETDYRSSLRWIARGLTAEHALCMTVSKQKAFNRHLPPEVIEEAERVISRDQEPIGLEM
jgi:hypothetical protein